MDTSFLGKTGKKEGGAGRSFFQKRSGSTPQDFSIKVMDQMRDYGSGFTGHFTLAAEWDLDNYA